MPALPLIPEQWMRGSPAAPHGGGPPRLVLLDLLVFLQLSLADPSALFMVSRVTDQGGRDAYLRTYV